MDCKVTAFRTNSRYNACFLIVKFLNNLHYVKYKYIFAFILLTFYTKNISFCYKLSKVRKKNPLFLCKKERGALAWFGFVLWMQRETKNQVGFLCTGVGSHLSEDGN